MLFSLWCLVNPWVKRQVSNVCPYLKYSYCCIRTEQWRKARVKGSYSAAPAKPNRKSILKWMHLQRTCSLSQRDRTHSSKLVLVALLRPRMPRWRTLQPFKAAAWKTTKRNIRHLGYWSAHSVGPVLSRLAEWQGPRVSGQTMSSFSLFA